jgi:hypothetical protein
LKTFLALIILLGTVSHHVYTVTLLVEKNLAVNESEERPITACADILTGDKFRPTLAHQDAARRDMFTAKSFDAQPFADAVAPVPDAALTFLMCHNFKP